MNKNKVSSILYYIASILFYITAILYYTGGNTGMGVVWLCLGSTNLCLGSVYAKKAREDNKGSEE